MSWRPRHFGPFAATFLAAFVAGLFVPTIELFKGSVSLGRAPLWLAYVGILAPEYWPIALPIVGAHLIVTLTAAWVVDRLLIRKAQLRHPARAAESGIDAGAP